MKKLFLVLAFFATPALAQISVTPGETPAPSTQLTQPTPKKPALEVRRAVPVKSASPAPSATPTPKKKGGFFGFFRRMFGGGESVEKAVPVQPTPTPAVRKSKPAAKPEPKQEAKPEPKPEATPKPSATPKATPQPQPTATPEPSATPTPVAAPKPSATPKPTATPKPISTPKPTATPKPTPETQATPEIPVPALPPSRSTDADEAKYLKTKQQALKDTHVTELHEKMVSILTAHPEGGEAYKAAAIEYTEALFGKMRQIDPANAEQITRKERATKRRLDAGLPIVQ